MRKRGEVQIKIQKNKFFRSLFGDGNLWNGDKLFHSGPMSPLFMMAHPCGQGHFVILENFSQITVGGNFPFGFLYNFFRALRRDGMFRAVLNLRGYFFPDGFRRFPKQSIHCFRFWEICPGVCLFQQFICFHLNGKLCFRFRRLVFRIVGVDHISGFENGISSLRGFQQLRKIIMGSQYDGIHVFVAGTFSVRQTEAAPYHLFPQNLRGRRAQWDDSIEVVYVPALFQHIHMNHDFHRTVRSFHFQKQTGILFTLRAFLLGVNDNRFIPVRAVPKRL